ncbi:MAG: hypothetical protein ACOCXH_00765 [Cyclobacteriaceae bacterium]
MNDQSQTLWNAEAWYTLNEIPENSDGQAALNQPNAGLSTVDNQPVAKRV